MQFKALSQGLVALLSLGSFTSVLAADAASPVAVSADLPLYGPSGPSQQEPSALAVRGTHELARRKQSGFVSPARKRRLTVVLANGAVQIVNFVFEMWVSSWQKANVHLAAIRSGNLENAGFIPNNNPSTVDGGPTFWKGTVPFQLTGEFGTHAVKVDFVASVFGSTRTTYIDSIQNEKVQVFVDGIEAAVSSWVLSNAGDA